jgi:hypothetical protein
MHIKQLALIGASFLTLVASAAQAQVAYTNGPTNGALNAWTINFGVAVTNRFTLSSATTITGFTFGAWTSPGLTATSVDWGISSAPDYSIDGTASLTNGAGSRNASGYDVYDYSASITPLTLAAGTWYFALQNAAIPAGGVYWDINNGPSVAIINVIGNADGFLFPGTNSTAFTLQSGAAAAVPEPASWAMMIGGFGMVGGALRRRQRIAVSLARA